MSEEIKLKPCPFCGGIPKLRNIGSDHTKDRRTNISCSTAGCAATISVRAIQYSHTWKTEKAVEKWNHLEALKDE